MKHRGSKDNNHDAICDTFRNLGCSVAEMETCGVSDFPDVVVGLIGMNHIVEIKNPETAYGRKGMTIGQKRWARDWNGGRVHLCHSPDEAVALVQNWRRNT